MSPFSPIQKLDVYRRLSGSQEVLVGQLAQNKQGVYFQYAGDYLSNHSNLSPFSIAFDETLSKAPTHPHQGLHGLFADSLPDGWGLLLMDRVFRQNGIAPQHVSAMDRLAYIGDSGIGALSYRPVLKWKEKTEEQWIDLASLGKQATQVFDGDADIVLAALANTGGSGGARPKALIYLDPKQKEHISIQPQAGLEPWLVKFTSQNLLLGHEEGLCEAAYLSMAKQAGITVPEWQLFSPPMSNNTRNSPKGWLATKRFDCAPLEDENGNTQHVGRYHIQTLCGLLDADFRQPSLDYEDCIKASQALCKSPAVGQQQFTRAIFNLFANNQDDHTKNWSFLMDNKGSWNLAPFYDITFSPNPHNQHMMAYGGYGEQPSLEAMQKLAALANFAKWKDAQQEINKVLEALSSWGAIAKELGVHPQTIKLISKQLDTIYQQNKRLLQ